MGLSEAAIGELRSIVEQTIAISGASTASQLPGTVVVVVDKQGNELFAHAAGKRGIMSKEPMTLDSVFYLASCTKLVAGIACMQLVEKGELRLDDAAQVEELCPELRDIKVLKDDGTFEEKKHGITLKMLLTHTAGFCYSFFDETLRDWSHPIGIDEFSGDIKDMLKVPLRFQPGTKWNYGIGIDWAGIVLQRKTGLSLNEYIQKNICEPLGLKNVNMIPTQSMKDNLAYMHQRLHDGKLIPRDHLLRRPLVVETPAEIADTFNSGGAGLFAKPQEYARILATLLNDGTCPQTSAQILSQRTVEQMFTNQIPQFPDFGRQGLGAAKPDLTRAAAELYPVPGRPPPAQGWGLTFMLSGASAATGRSARTGHWAGLPNLYWWADRGRGVAGFVCAQIMPAFDPAVVGLWGAVEATVNKHLKLAEA
ncbi:beta-lactamase family protein [Daldinia caldariorum]|uniref:beta-lactamase family protein n=1 Tax=Daldinia caldariorum TaxID=326644 RepID=UPI0020080B6E|nr:beta-lactamase family protein [Daldinia caldariorum]KAI1466078.1 beta-lactamase family protein [Daldinia caldariorum]